MGGNQRFDDRPHTRRPGAGRPRNVERASSGPVDLEILGAAARLFSRNGVAATTMAEIADAVGLGVSSIYYYFANKHAVLERIVDDVNRVPLAIADQVLETFSDAPCRLHAFIRNDAAVLCGFPFDINEVHRLAGEDRLLFGTYWGDRQRLVDGVEQLLLQGIADGDFRPIDAGLTALTVLSNDEAVQNWYRTPPTEDRNETRTPDDVGVFVADLALLGLLVDPGAIDRIRTTTAQFTRPALQIG